MGLRMVAHLTLERGWTVTGELQRWQFRLDVILACLRIGTSALDGDAILLQDYPVEMQT